MNFRALRANAPSLHTLARLVPLVPLALLAACTSDSRERRAPSSPATIAMPAVVPAWVAHRDAKLDAPSFVWITRRDLPQFASATEAASLTMRGLSTTFRLTPRALESLGAPQIHDDGAGPIVARFRQQVGGVDVFRGGLNMVLTRDFEPVAASGLVASSLDGAEAEFAIGGHEALARAYTTMTGVGAAFTDGADAQGYRTYRGPGLFHSARTKRVFFPIANAGGAGNSAVRLEPAHYVEIMLKRGGARSYVVSATTGAILFENNLVRNESFSYRAFASPQTLLPADGPQGNDGVPHPTGRPDGFRPTLRAPQLVTLQNFPFSKNDPWLKPTATTTEGNNVDAYADVVAGDGFDIGKDIRPVTTSPRTFDYVYDTSKDPKFAATQAQAASTHMFYTLNWLHDWFYDVGFDEKSGNPQFDNYGRGGREGDPITAEAQDYDGTNNADAATPADGGRPRIQMYVFSGESPGELTVSTPANIAGIKATRTASFGKTSFNITGNVLLAQDGQGADANDACEPLTNNVAGQIVLVHRGTCTFVQKALNVEAAGGLAIIITNVPTSVSPDVPPFLGGDGGVAIAALSLALTDGKAMEANLGAGVNVTMKRVGVSNLEGALDTAIVAHEWGHVLSNRLVADGNGLMTNQAGGLGEGWSDFVALLLIARDDDTLGASGKNWAGVYPTASYATLGSGADYYFGLRRLPYSVDPTKNPLTLKHISNGEALPTTAPVLYGEDGSFNSEVHASGEVWASMLWECYVGLLRDTRYTFAQAQERMKRYLVAGLKLTPPDPTLLEARDALLAATFAADERDFRTFFEGFAHRGAGVGALGPPKDSAANLGVKESFLVGNDIEIIGASVSDDLISCDHDGILDDGEVGTIVLQLRNSGVGSLSSTTVKLSSPVPMAFPDGSNISLGVLKPFDISKVRVRAILESAPPGQRQTVDITVDDPTLASPRTIKVPLTARFNSDVAEAAATTDNVDIAETTWVVAGKGGSKWSRSTVTGDGYWTVPDTVDVSDQQLTSAAFTIEGAAFTVAFKHRYSFRRSTRRNTDIDGGVVEISTNGGKLWRDAAEFAVDDYTSKLDTLGRGDNVLKGRRAYGGKSAGYPDQWISSSLQVALPEPPASVQVRFRQGTGSGFTGSPGWDVDDIALTGATSKPFWGYIPHADACDPEGPTADAGRPKTVKARTVGTLSGTGTHPTNLPLNFTWIQTAGPRTQKRGEYTSALSFDAPDTQENKTLSFVLRTNDGARLSPASKVDVTVVRNDPEVEKFTIGGGCTCDQTGRTSSGAVGGLGGCGALALALGGAIARRRKRERS